MKMDGVTTAELAIATLAAHGIDTVYGLPGLHCDPIFDALFKYGDRIRTIHARHEQGAGYMALGAALATGRPQVVTVVPGPGLLNAATALLVAHGTSSQVLALTGQIASAAIGRGFCHLHEMRDQPGVFSRMLDFVARIEAPEQASHVITEAMQSMRANRPGPALVECALDIWARTSHHATVERPSQRSEPSIDDDSVKDAAARLAKGERVLIVVGGGAQDASVEVTELSRMLQAPVVAYRRGRGVLDSRDPLSVPLPIGRDLWGEADVVLGVGTRMFYGFQQWGVDEKLEIIRVDADVEVPGRFRSPDVALIGDAAPILRRLISMLETRNRARPSRRDELRQRHGALQERLRKLAAQKAYLDVIRDELPEDGIYVDEITQMGFAARLLLPVYKPRTFLSPGYHDAVGWGYATALGAQDARRDVPVVSVSGDGGFLFTANEMATAVRHAIPLVAVVFNDNAFGNVRRIQQENYGNRLIASDLANPDFVRFAESFGIHAERARGPAEFRAALTRAFARRDPALIEVPVGEFPSAWEFINMPPVRGHV
jgi:acetolactate synthase I/II/III large subunit